jgi:hypothetical protein
MDERRTYLKELAARFARSWSKAPLPAAFAGETRIETRNTVYELVDGVCLGVRRQQGADSRRAPPSAYVGMRMIGWLRREDPQGGITHAWTPGAYAVLWRPRAGGEEHSAIALTSTSQAFGAGQRNSVPPAAPARPARASTPPPLPPARGALMPRPPTPPSWIPPAPPSMTRVHHGSAPPAPETPTPVRRTGTPPPLPARALASRSAVQRVPMAS